MTDDTMETTPDVEELPEPTVEELEAEWAALFCETDEG